MHLKAVSNTMLKSSFVVGLDVLGLPAAVLRGVT